MLLKKRPNGPYLDLPRATLFHIRFVLRGNVRIFGGAPMDVKSVTQLERVAGIEFDRFVVRPSCTEKPVMAQSPAGMRISGIAGMLEDGNAGNWRLLLDTR